MTTYTTHLDNNKALVRFEDDKFQWDSATKRIWVKTINTYIRTMSDLSVQDQKDLSVFVVAKNEEWKRLDDLRQIVKTESKAALLKMLGGSLHDTDLCHRCGSACYGDCTANKS